MSVARQPAPYRGKPYQQPLRSRRVPDGAVMVKSGRYRGKPYQRVLVVAASFGLAALLGHFAESLAPPPWKDFAMMSVVWISVYPIPPLNRRMPWQHWLLGGVVLIGFEIATLSFGA